MRIGRYKLLLSAAAVGVLGLASTPHQADAAVSCARTITANVVALDQPIMFNRLGAQNVNGMVYALRRDVVDKTTGKPESAGGTLTNGNVEVRPDKRLRPLVLRLAAGDCLTVNFQNLLANIDNPNQAADIDGFTLDIDDQVKSRWAGFHPQGLELVGGIGSDSSFVGQNTSSLVSPGNSATYNFYGPAEGGFLVTSHGATIGSEGVGGQTASGLFGVVNVEPTAADFYRSQVTEEELRLATTGTTADGHPTIDYEAVYPAKEIDGVTDTIWVAEGKAGLPIMNMLTASNEIVHSDLNAMIVGSNGDGTFVPATYPLESVGRRNPTVPNRLDPFREFTVVFHDEVVASQAFPLWYSDPVLGHTLHSVRDSFMINYGSGGIGSEIISNRLGVGPMHDCLSCAYEEFFLAAFSVGDPAMLVDVPATVGLEQCDPNLNNCEDVGPKATAAFFPADPSNVHHSYTSDFVKFRNIHAGPKEQHIFHLHNHQWLFNANDDNSNYLDAQGIGPGSGYTYEINFGGSGNRNKTSGDAIFHCHFYPHFAQGMWELWRVHDVIETGTELAVSGGPDGFHTGAFDLEDGTPALGARALPDGEIVAGAPIPALVPLPGKPMAPVPGAATVKANPNTTIAAASHPDAGTVVPTGSLADILDRDTNPGYPFWIAGIEDLVGQRPVTPVLDMFGNQQDASIAAVDGGWNGGLPRHGPEGVAAGGVAVSTQNRLDFTKTLLVAKPVYFPEEGTDLEQVAMAFHEERCHDSFLPDGSAADCDLFDLNDSGKSNSGGFITNGQPAVRGAPFNEPCIDDEGDLLLSSAASGGQFFNDQPGGFFDAPAIEFGAEFPRLYKASVIQLDAVFNKVGYHYPQQRIITLWEDALPTINKQKPPEPFVIRMNTFDCTMFLHTNLVPKDYELDDYQVRTPTDIIGQHIHLPKWDLTTADGSANGWNYEDGTLSPGMVRERIEAINAFNDLQPEGAKVLSGQENEAGHLEPLPHPFFGTGPNSAWLGARTTTQRWFADPVVNVQGEDRGLGIIFTHDHFGPSTHQQIGLYATVLTEPAGSAWVHNETGEPLYTRPDGGPTSWQVAILDGDYNLDGIVDQTEADKNFREFYLEFADMQHAYQPGVYIGAGPDGQPMNTETALGFVPDPDSFRDAINPSYRQQTSELFPDLFLYPPICPGGVPRPCPEAVDADDPGMLVVNYRNEGIGLRIYDPNATGPDGKPGSQAEAQDRNADGIVDGGEAVAGDLAFALATNFQQSGEAPVAITRAIPELNVQPDGATIIDGTAFPPPLNDGLLPTDPFTPMLRAHPGDLVRLKIQTGAHEEEHNASVHGVKWLQGGSGHGLALNSGWRNSQAAGISEQFTFAVPMTMDIGAAKGPGNQALPQKDHAYTTHTGMEGWWNGTWGIMRSYSEERGDLFQLPNNADPKAPRIVNADQFVGVCPKDLANSSPNNQVPLNLREYTVIAMTANELLGNPGVTIVPNDASATMHVGGPLDPDGGTLVFNPRSTVIPAFAAQGVVTVEKSGPLHDPTGLLYVRADDLEPDPAAGNQGNQCTGQNGLANPACQVRMIPGTPIEPLILRAAAGDCVQVTLFNRLPEIVPDLANMNTMQGIVPRDRDNPEGVTTFNNNLIRPSGHVGLHSQLVAYDVTQHDGTNVGTNLVQTVGPLTLDDGKLKLAKAETYRWYAGDLKFVPVTGGVEAIATPIEFGGTNIMPADKIKQGQKGMVGALIIEPQGSNWVEDASTRAAATVYDSYGTKLFRDFAVVIEKGMSHRYKDGTAVENIGGEAGGFSEDPQDMGQMAINHGSEPLWFRFGLPPHAPFGQAGFGGIENANEAYSNGLAGGDPVTPVFTADAGDEVKMHVLNPHGIGRGSTFNLHGHVWQRDPYVCPGSSDVGLPGKCVPDEVGSQAIGDNPLGMVLGGQESVNATTHFEMRLPSAGGADQVTGDYLFRDQASFGNIEGLWGILRVQ